MAEGGRRKEHDLLGAIVREKAVERHCRSFALRAGDRYRVEIILGYSCTARMR